MTDETKATSSKVDLPCVERIQQELASAKSIDDFFGKEGIFAWLFASTLEQMMAAGLTAQLSDEKHEMKGRESGNSWNWTYKRGVRSTGGQVEVALPRDRNDEYQPTLLHKYETSSNELENKVVMLYAKESSLRDNHDSLQDMYGVDISAATITAVTDKVWPLVETWQSRQLEGV